MMRHPTVETLVDHIENKLVGSESVAIAAHLDTCEACRAKAREFDELLAFLATDAENEPPADLLAWGIGLLQPMFGPPDTRTGRVRRFAKRVFDSFEQPVRAGARFGGALPRQLLYQTEGVDIDLRIEPGSDHGRISLVGQVLSDSEVAPTNTPVLLMSNTGVSFDAVTNPVGEFSFDSVPKHTYHLSVDLPDGEVTLFCVHRDPLVSQ